MAAAALVAGCGGNSVTVVRERPAQLGFYGNWYAPQDRGPWFQRKRPAILLLGGSEGGMPRDGALVAHGFPVLALAYFREPGLPQDLTRIPLEYFRKALEWMAKQPGVDPERIVTLGISRGGELSLLLASIYPDLIHGAVGYVPSANANRPGWTLNGRDVTGSIPAERINGPVFVVGAGDDHVWTSAFYVQLIATRMHAHGRHDVTALIYPRAGHAVGIVRPHFRESARILRRYGLGGSPAADEAAREDSWPKLLRFLGHL